MKFSRLLIVILITCFSAAGVLAQSSTTGAVKGTVTDPQGLVLPGAEVKLLDRATSQTRVVVSNEDGSFTFSNLPPGTYTITIVKSGFRTAEVADLTVEVNKTFDVPVALVIGQMTETVSVTAGAGVELQTTDAQVGNVIGKRLLRDLPTAGRSSLELISLQPTTTPGGFGTGGTVSGARSDQNTLLLDGIDVTDNLTGGQGVAVTQSPVGVDSLEEFRVTVANPNAAFGRSAGGQISMVSNRGGNDFHGAGYWYHQNDNLNANSWTNNRTRVARGELRDNRAGFSVNGPIWKNHTFFTANYEWRRFPQTAAVVRTVPTASFRSGVLQFRDAANNLVSYNLASSTACGETGGLACDPRGLGLSPTIVAAFAGLPVGNDPTVGDGLNTTGWRGNAKTSLSTDSYGFRLDHKLTEKMQFMGRYSYQRNLAPAGQLDVRDPNNVGQLRNQQNRGTNITGGLDYTISKDIVNSFRFGWIQNKTDLVGTDPLSVGATLSLPGTTSSIGPVAVDLAGLNEPIDVAAQQARTQLLQDRNIQFSDNVFWTKGTHSLNFGAEYRILPFVFTHDDQATFLTGPIVAAGPGTFLTIPAANRPPTCGGAVTTNCLRSGDVAVWNNLYAAGLGMIDNTSIVGARDGDLQPLPFGTDLVSETTMNYYQFHFQDTWRMSQSLTLTYGLNYSWSTPPTEKLDRIALVTDLATGEVYTAESYLSKKRAAAEQGQVFNPTFGVRPLNDSGRDTLFDTDYSNLGPRIAVAWNPTVRDGFMGSLLGDRKTVLRGGFAITYDRINTISVILPAAFAIGFGQVLQSTAPLCNASATPGTGCNAAAGATNRGLSAFRLGRDGNVPIPLFTGSTSPIVPGPLALGVTYATDPERKVGRNYMVDFTVQRELPAGMIFEAGYIGRFGRDLPTGIDLNASPYFHKDSASGQTFAQAYDRIACVLRGDAGQTFGSFTCPGSVQPQAWFENQLPGFGTAGMVANFSSLFLNNSVGTMFLQMNVLRQTALGLQAFNSLQLAAILMATSGGRSNYHAGFATLRTQPWHGLRMDLNYTLASSQDQVGTVQNQLSVITTGFDRDIDYGPSLADRRHVFNGIFTYDLPFGKGKSMLSGSSALDKIVGGWYLSGIFRAFSGLPLIVIDNSQVWGGSIAGLPDQGAIPYGDPSLLSPGVYSGVAGSNGIGTAGNPAAGGTGLNLFADPALAFDRFNRILLSVDTRQGRSEAFRGPGFWNLDFRLAKSTSITERVSFEFSADFFNLFNHVNLALSTTPTAPSLSLNSRANFGVFTTTQNAARSVQLGGRIQF